MMTLDWIFQTPECLCSLRTAGVLIQNGKLLVQRDKDQSEYALPGGHVKMGETTVHSLVREYKEETGADIRCSKLLWTEECFWTWRGLPVHTITFYYLIELCEHSVIADDGVFVPHHDNHHVLIGWMPIAQLPKVTIYPTFIQREIHDLNSAPKHFISAD